MPQRRVKQQVNKGLGSGHGGFAIAVHVSLTTQNLITSMNLDHFVAKEDCQVLKTQPPGCDALIIWGLHIPSADTSIRRETYNLFQAVMQHKDRAYWLEYSSFLW